MKKPTWKDSPDIAWREGANAMRRSIIQAIEKRRHPIPSEDYETMPFKMMALVTNILVDELIAAVNMTPIIHGDTE